MTVSLPSRVRSLRQPLLALILLAYAVIATLYAIYTPPWQVPDEPAHYNYVAQIVTDGCCPVIAPGDYDQAVLSQLTGAGFPPDADLSPIEYEDHQPPLYYLLATPLFALTGGDLTALRLFSAALGAGVVLLTYLVIARLLPTRPELALASAAFVAFVPQHVAMMAGVNNDSLAELVLGLNMLALVTYLGNPPPQDIRDRTRLGKWFERPPFEGGPLRRAGARGVGVPNALDSNQSARTVLSQAQDARPRPDVHPALLGLLAGLAFLTKATITAIAPLLVALAIFLRRRREGRSWGWFLRQAAWSGGVAILLGAVWWVRDVTVYGWPDLFGLATHDRIATAGGQLRTADLIAEVGPGAYLRQFATTTYHSFWGQFGWMGVPMPPRTYLVIGLFSLWDIVGFCGLLFAFRNRLRLVGAAQDALWLLAALIALTVVGFIGYNASFVQFQGRYLFPALPALGLIVALGVLGWSLLLSERWPILRWSPLALMGLLALLDLWALFRYIVPNLS